MCMNLVWTALHLFHFEISDLTPPSGSESGEAALRRLLACRATGGYAMSSDDPSPGSPTVFQSSRLARPQDASKALDLVSLLSISALLGSVGFDETSVEHVGLFFVARLVLKVHHRCACQQPTFF